uniref:Ephrin RBD domain-containing protein n=1 Tax=Mola mola TaxID=94237 RepID=A0A3Q3X5R9_MOLML
PFYDIPGMGRIAWSCGALVLLATVGSCRAATLASVLWSSSNPKFNAGQGLVLYPQIGDKMDIVCPRSDASSGTREEFYRVYLVSRSQMESCFTFKFQEFSPNLWGLEFLKGRDYYITSTSTGFLQGLDNTDGGVCRTTSMKLVGNSLYFCDSTKVNKPTTCFSQFPGSLSVPLSLVLSHESLQMGSQVLFVWVVSACTVLLVVVVALLAALWRCRRRLRRRVPESRQPASISLNTLAVPKRDSISSDNDGSDRSDVVFPLRGSDSMICRHYEPASCDYGPPVYIVQEITPQSPTNIYYKV